MLVYLSRDVVVCHEECKSLFFENRLFLIFCVEVEYIIINNKSKTIYADKCNSVKAFDFSSPQILPLFKCIESYSFCFFLIIYT